MDIIRSCFDGFYDIIKSPVFKLTKSDPQTAHEWFAEFCRFLHAAKLERLVLDNELNLRDPGFQISNAAGFNKDGYIPPTVLKYLGFDRVVVGTVTAEPYSGNSRPNIKRYVKAESMVNWMGLPGIGAEAVAEMLLSYGKHGVPLTVNVAPTPKKVGDDGLKDLERTISVTKAIPYVDRFELNISCPNTGGGRNEYLSILNDMLQLADSDIHEGMGVYLKVSPDSTPKDIQDIVSIAKSHSIKGVVTTNTTTNYGPLHISPSPERGGASGRAVYLPSIRTQEQYFREMVQQGVDWDIIACGGISSIESVRERLKYGAKEIQLFTSLVFSGPKLLRQLKEYHPE